MKKTESEQISEFVHGFLKVVTYQIQRCLGHLSLEVMQSDSRERIDIQKSLNDVIDVIAIMDSTLSTGDLWEHNRNVYWVKILAQYAGKLNDISRVFDSYQEDYAHHLSHFMYRCRSAGIDVD